MIGVVHLRPWFLGALHVNYVALSALLYELWNKVDSSVLHYELWYYNLITWICKYFDGLDDLCVCVKSNYAFS